MKNIIKLITIFLLIFSFSFVYVNAIWDSAILSQAEEELQNKAKNNLNTWLENKNNTINNNHLTNLNSWSWTFIKVSDDWSLWLKNVWLTIAISLKNLFYIIAWLYFLILVIKLIFTENSEEEIDKFKKWIIWISIWLLVMQVAFSFVVTLFDKTPWAWLAQSFVSNLIDPLTKLLETWASFLFIAIAIYAFFRMVSANWDEEKVKSWRMSIVYSIIWFIVVKISRLLVDRLYWKFNCWNNFIVFSNCTKKTDLEWWVKILSDIINWVNSFLWIIVLILIIYTWFQVIFGFNNEDSLNKAKKSIIYILIWMLLLFVNYLILTFFIIPESSII